MIKALIAGDGSTRRAGGAGQAELRRKRPALAEALTGRVTAHHRFMLTQLLRHIEFLDAGIATCDRPDRVLTAADADAVARVDTIPGVARRTAETIVAELGSDMTRFPTAGHAASWAGLCPAITRVPANASVAVPALRIASCARRSWRVPGRRLKRDCYLAAQYRRLVKRRGDKKAIVAVAHSILVIAYHVLRDGGRIASSAATTSITSMPSASPATTRCDSPRWAMR